MKFSLSRTLPLLAACILFALGFFLRLRGLWFLSFDTRHFLMPWYSQLAVQGFSAFQFEFSNYSPPSLYLLWLATLTRDFLPEVAAIKLIPILFDLGAAFWVYKILRVKYTEGYIPLLGSATFFILPTVILDGAWWGQCDSIFTSFALGSFYFVLRERPRAALILFGMAFAFKLQAIFLAPFLLFLLLKRRIHWTDGLLVPLVYVILILPAVMAGRPLWDALTIYFGQTGDFNALNLNAPNLYAFLPDSWYTPVLYLGLAGSAVVGLSLPIVGARRVSVPTDDLLLMCACVLALVMPFVLPKMHERYFYLSDVFLLLLAFYRPRLWYLPALAQIVSTLTYAAFLFFPPLPGADRLITAPALVNAAALINAALVALLLWEQFKLFGEPAARR